jgi:hypothetical protein
VVGVAFNDLRGTAVTRLALVGATEAEIASITGHSLRGVRPTRAHFGAGACGPNTSDFFLEKFEMDAMSGLPLFVA